MTKSTVNRWCELVFFYLFFMGAIGIVVPPRLLTFVLLNIPGFAAVPVIYLLKSCERRRTGPMRFFPKFK